MSRPDFKRMEQKCIKKYSSDCVQIITDMSRHDLKRMEQKCNKEIFVSVHSNNNRYVQA
jgi:hypothetical protein